MACAIVDILDGRGVVDGRPRAADFTESASVEGYLNLLSGVARRPS
jgi:hypothetical protein